MKILHNKNLHVTCIRKRYIIEIALYSEDTRSLFHVHKSMRQLVKYSKPFKQSNCLLTMRSQAVTQVIYIKLYTAVEDDNNDNEKLLCNKSLDSEKSEIKSIYSIQNRLFH